MNGWQSIETAPQDGSIFLGFDGSLAADEQVFVARWKTYEGWDHADGHWSNIIGDCDMCHPTHWQALPEPPK